MTEDELIDFMLESNIRIAYEDGDFNSIEESEKYWEDRDKIEIFKGYDKYMGTPEMIVDIIE